ncbi:MAG: hypothetical protein ACAI35_15655 [Candidatus Methylacidiphilales bacterium]
MLHSSLEVVLQGAREYIQTGNALRWTKLERNTPELLKAILRHFGTIGNLQATLKMHPLPEDKGVADQSPD